MLTDLFALADVILGIHTITKGPSTHLKSHLRKPHSAHCTPPANPIHPTLIQDCMKGLTLSHLLHLRQTTTSHTSSCHSHRIAHAERVEHRRGKLKNRWEMLR